MRGAPQRHILRKFPALVTDGRSLCEEWWCERAWILKFCVSKDENQLSCFQNGKLLMLNKDVDSTLSVLCFPNLCYEKGIRTIYMLLHNLWNAQWAGEITISLPLCVPVRDIFVTHHLYYYFTPSSGGCEPCQMGFWYFESPDSSWYKPCKAKK